MAKEKYRARVHMLLLYPENEIHANAVEKIKSSYDYAMVLHNRDVTEEGELKKEHWHIVLRFSQAVWNTAIAKELGIEERFIEQSRKFENSLQYLMHYNDTDKVQYSIDEISGTLKKRLQESINKVEKSEGEKVTEIIEYIDTQEKITFRDFAKYCAENGYWPEFRRSASIFIKIIEEHNYKIENRSR